MTESSRPEYTISDFHRQCAFPKIVEPPMGRRHARVLCQVDGCDTRLISGPKTIGIICRDCYRLLPVFMRKRDRVLHRKYKQALADREEFPDHDRSREYYQKSTELLVKMINKAREIREKTPPTI